MDREAWWATVHGLQRVKNDSAANTNTKYLKARKFTQTAIKKHLSTFILLTERNQSSPACIILL